MLSNSKIDLTNKAEAPCDYIIMSAWYNILQPEEGYLLDRTTSSARSTGPVSGCSITWSPDFTLRLV